MRWLLVCFLLFAVLFYGCITSKKQLKEDTDNIYLTLNLEEKAPEKKDEIFDEEERKIVEDIEYALSLEALIWEKREQIMGRQDIVEMFRKGFCKAKAEEITDYVWIEAVDRNGNRVYMLNPGEPLFSTPDSIEVVFEDRMNARALLIYNERLTGPVTWSGHTIVAIMKKEGGVWKICETSIEKSGED